MKVHVNFGEETYLRLKACGITFSPLSHAAQCHDYPHAQQSRPTICRQINKTTNECEFFQAFFWYGTLERKDGYQSSLWNRRVGRTREESDKEASRPEIGW